VCLLIAIWIQIIYKALGAPVPASQEAKARGSLGPGSWRPPGQPYTIPLFKRKCLGAAQVIERLPNKREVPNSNPVLPKEKQIEGVGRG
jgi:hypothetical protein